jgi:hypothetical protein
MANALQIAGATGSKQTRYAPILIHKFFKGLWTQRNPFTDAGTAFLVEKFYSGTSFDGLIDGLNVELTNRLTIKRRHGATPYNTSTFNAIQRFYEFRRTTGTPAAESITLMADTATSVYNATGPSTQQLIFNKTAGAGQTSFLGVGTSLYMGDSLDLKKWLQPAAWSAQTTLATTQYSVGTAILDPDGNLEYLNSVQVASLAATNVSVSGKVVILACSPTNFAVTPGMSFTPAGLTGASFLNGKLLIALTATGNTVTAFFDHPNYGPTADTGTLSTTDVGTPATTGGSMPTFGASYGNSTADGLITWVNFGAPVYNWTPAPPTAAPYYTPFLYSDYQGIWQASTTVAFYTALLDSSGNVQRFTTASSTGVTGSTLPNFTPAPSRTGDNGNIWEAAAWLGSSTSYAATSGSAWAAGVTLASPPGPLWVCVDSNGNLQLATVISGTTGASAPSWSTTVGGTTDDNGIIWTNYGPFLALAFQGWQYGYAYHCVDGSVSTLSPLSPLTNGVLGGVIINGLYSTDSQVDSVWIFRTEDGGANPLQLVAIPNNVAGGTWTYLDQNPDTNLDFLVVGPQNLANNPAPLGFLPDCYHLGRIVGHAGNTVYWSGGADTLTGNGNTAFPRDNFVMPSLVNRIVPLAIGMLIFTTSGCYFSGIGGANADTPTAPAAFMDGKLAGLMSYNALDLVGSTVYMVNSKKKGLQVDISTGPAEIAFPIGDLLAQGDTNYQAINPASCYVAWHEQDSTDSALYLAQPGAPQSEIVNLLASPNGASYSQGGHLKTWTFFTATPPTGLIPGSNFTIAGCSINNGSYTATSVEGNTVTVQETVPESLPIENQSGGGGTLSYTVSSAGWWYRMNPTPAPENGVMWSPIGVSQVGFSAMQSVETSPGVHQLLMGPPAGGAGPILMRNTSTFADNGTPYPAYADIGSVVLAHPGQVALLDFLSTYCVAAGSRPTVSVLLGEIGGHAEMLIKGGTLSIAVPEPPENGPAEATTIYNDRWWMSATQQSALCQHLQIEIAWPAENEPNELLSYALFGAHYQEL